MKFLIKMVLQFPAFFFVYSGVELYIQGTIPQSIVTVLVLLANDIAEKFLSKS